MEESPHLSTKRRILEAVLDQAPFVGWQGLEEGDIEKQLTLEAGTFFCLFPGSVDDVMDFWHAELHQKLENIAVQKDLSTLKIRERIHFLVFQRLMLLDGHQEAVRTAMAYHALSTQVLRAKRYLYEVTDHIWRLAGDTATDSNFYSKRFLLSTVYSSTLIYWLQDASEDSQHTSAFLERRIENVLSFGGLTTPVKQACASLGEGITHILSKKYPAHEDR